MDGKTALDVATLADADKDLLSELAKRSVKQRSVKETSSDEETPRKSRGRRILLVPVNCLLTPPLIAGSTNPRGSIMDPGGYAWTRGIAS